MITAKKHAARNVLGEAWKDKYYGIQVISSTTDGNSIGASANLLATCWESGGGGTVAILNTDQLNERKPKISFFRGHTGAVQDIQFCPFYSTIFATASEDTTVKLWDCGNTWEDIEPRQDAVATLKGHSKRVCFTAFNEAAEWVIASGSVDGTVKLWDMEVLKDVKTHAFESHPVCLRWNASASMLALTSKNRELTILDPRADRIVGKPLLAHEGAKPAKVDWCCDSRSAGADYLVTSGFSKSAERQIRLWDLRNLSTYVVHADLDRGSASLQPYVDPGTGLLMLYGKGNRSIHFFGIESTDFIKFGEFEQLDPWKDIAIAPKRCVDVKRCEIIRCYGSLSSGIIQPVSLCVPRRNMNSFQADLFPDCLKGEAALKAEEWFAGVDVMPKTAPMEPVDGASPFEEKRPVTSGHLDFSREQAPVRGTSSVLRKRLSVTAQNSKSLMMQLEALEDKLALKESILLEQEAEIKELRKQRANAGNSLLPPAKAGSVGPSIASVTEPSRAGAISEELDRKLAGLALRTSLNEENVADLRKLLMKSQQPQNFDLETPHEIVKLLLDRIAKLQRRCDRVLQRNETLEGLYSSLRKI